MLRATAACTFWTSQLPKVQWGVFTSWVPNLVRATTTCTFSTAQRPKALRCWFFLHLDLEMCFPQPRALFNELNFHKSDNDMFLAVWHRNVLRATTACKLWSLIWRDGSAPATLASLLFDPLEPQNIGKTKCFATFLPFRAPGSSFYWLFLFWLLLFWLFLFSDCSHLCFSICPYCRKFDF